MLLDASPGSNDRLGPRTRQHFVQQCDGLGASGALFLDLRLQRVCIQHGDGFVLTNPVAIVDRYGYHLARQGKRQIGGPSWYDAAGVHSRYTVRIDGLDEPRLDGKNSGTRLRRIFHAHMSKAKYAGNRQARGNDAPQVPAFQNELAHCDACPFERKAPTSPETAACCCGTNRSAEIELPF